MKQEKLFTIYTLLQEITQIVRYMLLVEVNWLYGLLRMKQKK